MTRHHLMATLAALRCTTALHAKDIKIAHVYDKTGALEAYAKQTPIGLMMGLEYATKGTMSVNGNKLVVIEKDSQGKPAVADASSSPRNRCWAPGWTASSLRITSCSS